MILSLVRVSYHLLFLSVLCLLAPASFAQETANSAFQKGSSSGLDQVNIYTDCGIGAAIFKHDIAAAISNIIWDLGTTAAASAISSKGSCNGTQSKAALFIHETYPVLVDETARGQGQHLTALVHILGCAPHQKNQAIHAMRQQLNEVVSAESYTQQTHQEKAQNYYQLATESVQNSCQAS